MSKKEFINYLAWRLHELLPEALRVQSVCFAKDEKGATYLHGVVVYNDTDAISFGFLVKELDGLTTELARGFAKTTALSVERYRKNKSCL